MLVLRLHLTEGVGPRERIRAREAGGDFPNPKGIQGLGCPRVKGERNHIIILRNVHSLIRYSQLDTGGGLVEVTVSGNVLIVRILQHLFDIRGRLGGTVQVEIDTGCENP